MTGEKEIQHTLDSLTVKISSSMLLSSDCWSSWELQSITIFIAICTKLKIYISWVITSHFICLFWLSLFILIFQFLGLFWLKSNIYMMGICLWIFLCIFLKIQICISLYEENKTFIMEGWVHDWLYISTWKHPLHSIVLLNLTSVRLLQIHYLWMDCVIITGGPPSALGQPQLLSLPTLPTTCNFCGNNSFCHAFAGDGIMFISESDAQTDRDN